jgi:hypothetical protein
MMIAMKIDYPIDQVFIGLEDILKEVDELLEGYVQDKQALKWKDRAIKTLSQMLGEHHPYVKEFTSITFITPFMDDMEKVLLEDTYRLGLEDAKSFLIAMLDELESEYYNALGLMDMESLFAEMNRYVSIHVPDKRMKDSLHTRITRLREGMISGDITGDEITSHVKQISHIDTGLFKRIVPLLTWYYMHRDGVSEVHNI